MGSGVEARHPRRRMESLEPLSLGSLLHMKNNDHLLRCDELKATEAIRNFVTNTKALRNIAEMVLDICEHANDSNPRGWEVTLQKDSLCVNVGQIAIMIIGNKYGVAADRAQLYCGEGAQDLKARFDNNIRIKKKLYPSVPIPGGILDLLISEFSDLTARERDRITQSQLNLVDEANRRRKGLTKWHQSHSRAIIDYFNGLCKREVPQPGYWVEPKPPMNVADLVANKETEKAAVKYVTEHYRSLGYQVTSVESMKIGYDLECVKNGRRLHIEVKGRMNADTAVILTRGEYQFALKDNKWLLAIITNPKSANPKMEPIRGQRLKDTFRLDPVAYRLLPWK